LKRILEGFESGRIRKVAIDTAEPSLFSHEILNANPYAYLDDAPLEERRARAVQLRRTLRSDFAGGAGILDPAAIQTVAQESWPDVRDADELHDALLTLIVMPPSEEWRAHFEELSATGRAHIFERGGKCFWVSTERRHLTGEPLATVRGWMDSMGPVTAASLADTLAFPNDEIESALLQLEAEGQVMRGRYSSPLAADAVEWCNRRILARIHRLTLGQLRREIEPVTAAQFQRFLHRWQHLVPGSRLHGVDGTLQIIKQLQGYEISAAAWEPEVLARRIARYERDFLDQLCLAGEVMWARLSPHPAFEDPEPRRVRPTRTAPIAIFLRESADWLGGAPHNPMLSHSGGEVLVQLQSRGACFFNDLVRATGRLASELEDGLWELVAAGLVTADGFENLRSLVDPKRRRGEGRGKYARPRHAAGRWAMVRHASAALTDDARAAAFADQLLERWGVIFRDLLARESLAPPWRDLLLVLRKKEAQGEIRGGRFVSGFTGEQFARPEALDLLRAVRRSEPSAEDNLDISNADPLNLAGIILPGPRVSTLIRGTQQYQAAHSLTH
jgi:ATP-dependent Lhr-like helicase